MGDVLLRFSIVWALLHLILAVIEWYRYKHGNWSWYGFKNDGMLVITYIILCFDQIGAIIAIVMGLGYWILQPIIN